ncbi:N-acetylmuramoyl-L-alanine amidase [Pannus brasiliensis CCIBt3594]|uniref:N-acetylmuramoyl-L-alanine amidase n=1 Tax=Pannus brasiliensis CCIBt3594 TaxID=1427578 RepID=A0AAW9QWR2_9CHRO
MRFSWLFLSALAWVLVTAPAMAGKLVFWRFDNSANRLVFTTDDRVQPRAQMITNPTRIVVDLPGIKLGQGNVNQPLGDKIRGLRIGQFDAETTRVVIELAPGYTVDPRAVKIRGISPTQWTIELPDPQAITESLPPPTPESSPPPDRQGRAPGDRLSPRPPSPPPTETATSNSEDFQITRNGLFVRLERNGDERSIRVRRARDGKQIEVELPGAILPNNLQGQTLPVNQYGVGDIQFTQTSNSARVALRVSSGSPDWQALYSRFGGLVLLPRGGLSSSDNLPSPTPTRAIDRPRDSARSETPAIVSSIEIDDRNDRLLIRADRSLQGSGQMTAGGVYEIRVENARLADSFRGPQLGRDSPIYQLRVRQEGADRVVVSVQTARGFQPGRLNGVGDRFLALELLSGGGISRGAPPTDPSIPIVLSVIPPPITSIPPRPVDRVPDAPTPSPPIARQRNGRILVVIDPGHGGKDPGAIGIGGLQEKDVILPISLEVSRILQQQGIDVRLTRDSDFFVTLQGRTDMANRIDADLFVSIHANSMGKGREEVSGLEVYYFGDRRLSDTIHRNIIRSVDIRDRGVRRARFYVLRTSNMPSTLVEVGFVTGAIDAANLQQSSYQRQMAAAIARGIVEYIQQNLR